jgi:hypothetical protein
LLSEKFRDGLIETLGERYALENFSEFSVKTQLFVQREI